MTMIACTLTHKTPVIFGDLLITSKDKPDSFILPSVSNNIMDYLKEGVSFHPLNLSQKIYLLKPNVCVALAGSTFFMKRFLEDITMYCKLYDIVQESHMKSFLEDYDQSDIPEDALSFLIFVSEKMEERVRFSRFTRGNAQTIESSDFGKVVALGSGADGFLQEVVEAGTIISQLTHSTIEYAVQINTILVSKILAKERALLSTVNKYWGAGFEMVFLNDGVFSRFDDMTYILNQGQFDEKGDIEVPVPAIILHYKYVGEKLNIIAIAPNSGETEETDTEIIIRYKSFHVNQFVVESLKYEDCIRPKKNEENTSFTSFRNGMGYIIEAGSGKYIPASFHVGPELKVEYQHLKSVTITMKKEINDAVTREAKKGFP